MGLFSKLLGSAERGVQRMAEDNSWNYVRVVCNLDVKSLPASLVDDAQARMVQLYNEMARRSEAPFNIPEEAALRLAFVAARAAASGVGQPAQFAIACAQVLTTGKQEIRPFCLSIVSRALESVSR